METNTETKSIAYKKAQKRVKEITNYYWFLAGYIIIAVVLLYRDYAQNIFHFSREYIELMLVLQGIFLLLYGLYLFIPALHNWEERKINKLMKKNQQNGR